MTESVVEEAALAWLQSIGWRVVHDPDVVPDLPAAQRAHYRAVLLAQRLREANVRGEKVGLAEDELVFCDALQTNGSAVKIFEDETHSTRLPAG